MSPLDEYQNGYKLTIKALFDVLPEILKADIDNPSFKEGVIDAVDSFREFIETYGKKENENA